ncbi:helix-turn-helix domain-containing protein [Streptomyces sp. NPDC058294]|uniref:helix-turn-helix domain-containing protein n=1 Tax=Streptomyces sp. NPDC058294 TaxID=3346430 RepID=UPI0036EA0E55
MPAITDGGVGRRIAYYRHVVRPKMTQQELANAACVALGTIRKIERGERGVTHDTLQAIADALVVDPARLRHDRAPAHSQARDALPALSAAIAAYGLPRRRAGAADRRSAFRSRHSCAVEARRPVHVSSVTSQTCWPS